ncbi:MAG: hypothetical protein AAF743_17105, partial [Planctomycetota bacterium]
MNADVLLKTRVVLSLLHQRVGESSAELIGREKPILAWTLDRLEDGGFTDRCVICWDDQVPAVQRLGVTVHSVGTRRPIASVD